jgi:hypothetical protein
MRLRPHQEALCCLLSICLLLFLNRKTEKKSLSECFQPCKFFQSSFVFFIALYALLVCFAWYYFMPDFFFFFNVEGRKIDLALIR